MAYTYNIAKSCRQILYSPLNLILPLRHRSMRKFESVATMPLKLYIFHLILILN